MIFSKDDFARHKWTTDAELYACDECGASITHEEMRAIFSKEDESHVRRYERPFRPWSRHE